MGHILFQDISQQVIKLSQIQAKWENDQERRYLANFALDMYNGLYQDYLNQKIDQTVSDQGDLSELKKYIDSMNLLKGIINDTSLVFAEKPEVSIIVNGDIHEAFTEALNTQLDGANWYVVLNELNRLVNLFYDMIAVPVTRDGKIEIDLVTPDKAFIYNNDFDPTTSETTFYLVSELPNDQKTGKRCDVYMACNKDGKQLVTVEGYNGLKPIIVSYTGDNYEEFQDDTKYPYNPAIAFRNYYPLSSYWHPGFNPLVESDLNNDMRLTEFNMSLAYQLPLLVTTGLENSTDITKGQKARINFPPVMTSTPTDAKYITPDQKIDQLGKQIYEKTDRLKMSHKLSKSTISGQSATSGYELMLSKSEVLAENERQQKYYVEPIVQLCQCIMALSNQYGLGRYPDNAEISVTFGKQKFTETPKERITRQQMELSAGLKNLVDVEIENSDGELSREDALLKVTERKNENKTLSVISAPEFTPAKLETV